MPMAEKEHERPKTVASPQVPPPSEGLYPVIYLAEAADACVIGPCRKGRLVSKSQRVITEWPDYELTWLVQALQPLPRPSDIFQGKQEI
jgi:hypothetical protein